MVHIPERAGYWAESLEVMDLCLQSLRENTGEPFDLMVLDNASCQEVQDHLLDLRRQGVINYLILASHNMRKLGAVKFLLGSAPGEIITLTDSDVFFAPGWFEATLAVLEAFPEAGQVTALPTGDRVGTYCSATVTGARADDSVELEEGPRLIPERCLRAHATSLGVSWEEYERRMGDSNQHKITRRNISAFVSAQDFQYTTTQKALARVLPLAESDADFYDVLYSPIFESALDKAGFWRLSTEHYFAHHLGNRMPEPSEILGLFGRAHPVQSAPKVAAQQRAPLRRRVWQNRRVRRAMKAINAWTYRVLFE